jgi:serine/threonine protein kinase
MADRAATATVEVKSLAPGDLLNERFEVIQELGGGGFATVYEVFDTDIRRYWALKLFRSTSADEALQRELDAVWRIQHPNVLHVFWVDRVKSLSNSGTPKKMGPLRFLISELLQGETLETYIRGGETLPDSAIVQLGLELMDALIAIHPDIERMEDLQKKDAISGDEWTELQELQELGIIHRDIKPANLMLTPQGLKLFDFNIASRIGDPVYTRQGTTFYMPPESDASGTAWHPNVDLFAAGVVLYELICRAHPYAGLSNDEKDLLGDYIKPSRFRPDISEELQAFLAKACSKSGSERFQSAREMKREWERATQSMFESHREPARSEPRTDSTVDHVPRRHIVNEGGTDQIEVRPGEIEELSNLGAGWPAVLSSNSDGDAWASFGESRHLQGESPLLDACLAVVSRELPAGGTFQVSEKGVYVWSLGRQIVEFV